MAIATFSPPKGWEDWATLALGVWLWASPWTLQVSEPTASQNFLVVGSLVIVAELFTFYTLRLYEEWINIVLGIWLLVSPWLLGFTVPAGIANAVATGALLLALALYERWNDRDRQSA